MQVQVKKGNQVNLLLTEAGNVYAKFGSNAVGFPASENQYTEYAETPTPVTPALVISYEAEHDVLVELDTETFGLIVSNTGELFAKAD